MRKCYCVSYCGADQLDLHWSKLSLCCLYVNMVNRWLPGLARGELEDTRSTQVKTSPFTWNVDTWSKTFRLWMLEKTIHSHLKSHPTLISLISTSLSFACTSLLYYRLLSGKGSQPQPSESVLSQRLLVGWQGGAHRARRLTQSEQKWSEWNRLVLLFSSETTNSSSRSS